MLNIYLKYLEDISEICMRNALYKPTIYLGYSRDIPDINLRCILDLSHIQDVPEVHLRYVRYVRFA